MRSKRLLTMLLVVCMLISTLSPAVSAVSYGRDTAMNAISGNTVTNNKTSQSNSLLVSGDDTNGLLNLRDNPITKSEIEIPEGSGSWEAVETNKKPSVSLTLDELPECLEELKKADEKGESIFESREDAERGFYFVEDDKVKSAVVEYARRSFPDFHPEWGKTCWIRYIWPW